MTIDLAERSLGPSGRIRLVLVEGASDLFDKTIARYTAIDLTNVGEETPVLKGGIERERISRGPLCVRAGDIYPSWDTERRGSEREREREGERL